MSRCHGLKLLSVYVDFQNSYQSMKKGFPVFAWLVLEIYLIHCSKWLLHISTFIMFQKLCFHIVGVNTLLNAWSSYQLHKQVCLSNISAFQLDQLQTPSFF